MARIEGRGRLAVERPGLVGQHNGDAVADGKRQAGLIADQLLPLGVIAQRLLGQRTDEDLQQLGIDAALAVRYGLILRTWP
jgi:hypothetical protein